MIDEQTFMGAIEHTHDSRCLYMTDPSGLLCHVALDTLQVATFSPQILRLDFQSGAHVP
jgi:hypothetical protein